MLIELEQRGLRERRRAEIVFEEGGGTRTEGTRHGSFLVHGSLRKWGRGREGGGAGEKPLAKKKWLPGYD